MMVMYFFMAVICGGLILLFRNRSFNILLFCSFIVAELGLSIYAFLHSGQNDSLYFNFDSIGIILTTVLSILSIATFYHSYLYHKRHPINATNESIYYASLILLITAMTGAYFTNHMGVLWAWLEATTLSVSVLIYHERTATSLEATWKYVFICSIGISIAFIGILFLSIVATKGGLTNLFLSDLMTAAKVMDVTWLKIAFLLLFTGFSAKLGIFPLHTVCVDAHTAAPTPISAFISTSLMNVGFIGIFRMYSIIAQTEAHAWANHILMISGVLSISISAMQLLRVKHFKRMFAFSSLEHMGIVAVAIAVGGLGYYAAILHIVLHSFAKAGLFYQIGQVDSILHTYWIKETGGYMKINPLGAIVISLLFLMITAIPPSGLFVSELMVFTSLFNNHYYLISIVLLLLLTVAIFSLGRNFMQLLYSTDHTISPNVTVNGAETISQFILTGLIIYLAYSPPVFFTDLINSAIAHLV
ncbi:MAG: proton-conducting transporter membrane subunit [Chitinophagaceae bacterium]